MYSKLLCNLLFLLFFCNILHAQLPHLFPTINGDTIKPNSDNEKKYMGKKYMVGLNVSKMILRPIFSGGFTIDLEAHRFLKKNWAYGFEAGYTEYYWRSANSRIHNKGTYLKPMFSYVKKYRDGMFMISAAVPMGIFDEMGQLEVGNNYYYYNPKYLTYHRKSQFFVGTELIATVQNQVANQFYICFGGRFAPFIYRPIVRDDVPMNTRYFAGTGYNVDYNDINTRPSSGHSAFALFMKMFVHF